jgi:cell wall-associated NlpC family hydrolase
MNTKYPTILLAFISIALQACSQQNYQVIVEDEMVSVEKDAFNISDTTRASIVEKAHEYIGVGYSYGKSDAAGFDCSGFVKFVYGSFGYTLPHSSYEQYIKSRHIKACKARPGDLVFFNISGRQISHVGIYLGNSAFIHSPSMGKKVTIESLETDYYKKHLAGFGTFL